MYVDDKNKQLWAVGSDLATDKRSSGIFVFDLENSHLLHHFEVADTIKHFFNDLVLDGTGNTYITDSDNQAIYKVDQNKNLSVYYSGAEIIYPNGISISEDGMYLYVASFVNGIRVIDFKTKTIVNQADTRDNTGGMDGLKYYKNSLIGVQNGFQTKEKHKIVRYYLDKSQTRVVRSAIISENNPHFDTPTTFVIKDDHLYWIANSQLSNLNQQESKINNREELKPIIILKYQL